VWNPQVRNDLKLVGTDTTEVTLIRRRLHPWSPADTTNAQRLVRRIAAQANLSSITVDAPQWETNVYPLFYHVRPLVKRGVYDHALKLVLEHFTEATGHTEALREHLTAIVNGEIDILVEDTDYFVFLEAKVPQPDGKLNFRWIKGVHQLVRQYIQGKILERLIGKRFQLVVVGSDQQPVVTIPELKASERALLSAVGQDYDRLEFPNVPWTVLDVMGSGAAS
jgi:hypothetical protein